MGQRDAELLVVHEVAGDAALFPDTRLGRFAREERTGCEEKE